MISRMFLILSFFISSIYAQNVDEVINQVQKKYKAIQTLSAKYLLTHQGESGKFFLKKENKYRIELTNSILILNDESVWNYTKSLNRVIISRSEDSPELFSFDKFITEYPKISTTSIVKKEKEHTVIRLIPKSDELEFKSADVWINSENVVYKLSMKDHSNHTLTVELIDIKLNENLADSLFEFSQKKGCKVIDLR